MHRSTYSRLSKILVLTVLLLIVTYLAVHSTSLAQVNSNGDIIENFVNGSKKELKIGLRAQSYPISFVDPNSGSSNSKSYNGFCDTFADQAFEDLKVYLKQKFLEKSGNYSDSEIDGKVNSIALIKSDVINLAQGKRFDGVIRGLVDIECGANSIQYNTEVEFSDPFFSTGISLMTKKDNLEKISQNEEGLGNLKIMVVSGTTTYDWLVKEKGYKNFVPYSSRPDAISALKNEPSGAYASDYIILKGILEQDSDLRKNYDLYPKYLKKQDYGLVVKTGQSKLKDLVNEKTIKSSKLSNKIQDLKSNYSISKPLPFGGGSVIKFIRELFSSQLIGFLIGIAVSILILMFSFRKTRQLVTEILKKLWEQVLPDIVRWLYNLLQLIIRPKG
jgi:ABC-type amino acid transport substrate-binding protein